MDGHRTQIGALQERVHDDGYDYAGTPHLAHPELRSWIVDLVSEVVQRAVSRGLPPRVLEIGAGDGGLTEPLLARGFEVTATEVSRPAIERLESTFGGNPHLQVIFDAEGETDAVYGGPFSTILSASVLHHIPDYLAFVDKVAAQHLAPGGSFVSVQDPLRYDTMSPLAHRVDRVAYLIWRLGRPNRLSGLVSLKNRITGRLDPSRPGDMVEYHVVRNGVDEHALQELFDPTFRNVNLLPYWSSQSRLAFRFGRRLGLVNQFALLGEDHLARGDVSATWASAARVSRAASTHVRAT
jgi:SAM-dependent methyltransferase